MNTEAKHDIFEIGLTSDSLEIKSSFAQMTEYTPTNEQILRGLKDKYWEVATIFAKRDDYTPTPEHVEAVVNSDCKGSKHAYLRRNDVRFSREQQEQLFNSSSDMELLVVSRKEYIFDTRHMSDGDVATLVYLIENFSDQVTQEQIASCLQHDSWMVREKIAQTTAIIVSPENLHVLNATIAKERDEEVRNEMQKMKSRSEASHLLNKKSFFEPINRSTL